MTRKKKAKERSALCTEPVSPEQKQHVSQLLGDVPLIVFDLETTGGNAHNGAITEIFALRYRRGVIEDTFYSLVNPQMPIPYVVRKMTGISNATVRSAPTIKTIMPDILDFIGEDGILVGHNAICDVGFIVHNAEKCCQRQVRNFFLCTHLLSDRLLEPGDRTLSGLARSLGVAVTDSHRAKDDTLMTLEVLKCLLDKLQEAGIETVEEAIRLQGDLFSLMRLGWSIPPARLEDLPKGPGYVRLKRRDGSLLWAAAMADVQRDMLALSRFHELPKGMLRLVSQAHDLEWEAERSFLSYLALEATEQKHCDNKFTPNQWFQRRLPALCICRHGKDFRIHNAHAHAGSVLLLGPVHDKRLALELLDGLAEGFGVPVRRDGVILDPVATTLVVKFWTADSTLPAANLWTKLQVRWREWTDSSSLDFLKALGPRSFTSLLARSGVIFLPSGHKNWELIPLCLGRPGPSQNISEVVNPEEWIQTQPGRLFLKSIRTAEHALADQCLEAEKEYHVNAILWWLWRQGRERKNGPFFRTLKQLSSVAESSEGQAQEHIFKERPYEGPYQRHRGAKRSVSRRTHSH